MGLPTGFQYSITAIGSMVMQSANNSLGSIYVSGFTAAVKIKQFALCPFDALATAASVFCSQNLGAGQAKRIRQGLFQGIAVSVGYGLFAGLILILFGRPLSMMFLSKDNVEVLDASAKYLRCMGYFYWSLGVLNVSRMVTQGLGFSGRAFFSGVTEMIARIDRQRGLCGDLWLYGHLFCGSDGLGICLLLYFPDLSVLYEKSYKIDSVGDSCAS